MAGQHLGFELFVVLIEVLIVGEAVEETEHTDRQVGDDVRAVDGDGAGDEAVAGEERVGVAVEGVVERRRSGVGRTFEVGGKETLEKRKDLGGRWGDCKSVCDVR